MLDRRGFLKFAGGAGIGIVASPVIWKNIDETSIWTQNWPWIPTPTKGENSYATTISKLCPSNQGIKVRLIADNPVTIHGDDVHPLSMGALSALAASEAQLLHSPARLKQPMLRGQDGNYVAITWEEAVSALTQNLKKAAKDGIWTISGDSTTTINEALSAISNANNGQFFLMPGEEQAAQKAWSLMNGKGKVGYDIKNADLVLAVGAGVLESWGTVVSNRKAWSNKRPVGKAPQMELLYASQVQDNTASCADMWLPLNAGQELIFLLGIAHLLLKDGKSASFPAALPTVFSDANTLIDIVKQITPQKVEELCGIPVAKLQELEAKLLKAKAPLIIAGSAMAQGTSPAVMMAAYACNILLSRLDVDGGMRSLADTPAVIDGSSTKAKMRSADLMKAIADLTKASKKPGAIIFYEANPCYALPKMAKDLFATKAFTVSFSCFMDETTKNCDLILPCAMGLERFDDAESPYGCGEFIYSLAKPVVAPFYDARNAGDIILDLSKQLGVKANFKTWVDVLKAKTKVIGADFAKLMDGTPFTTRHVRSQEDLAFGAKHLTEALKEHLAVKSNDKLALSPVYRLGVGTAETGIPPYAVKLVNAKEVNKGLSIAHLNSNTAKALSLRSGDKAKLSANDISAEVLILIDEAVSNNCVSLLCGMGHTAFDEFSQNKGVNVLELISPKLEKATDCYVWNTNFVSLALA